MKRLLSIILIIFCCETLYSQQITLDFCVGTWEYTNPATGEEFLMKLKKSQIKISRFFGGGVEECLVGGYIHKRNNAIFMDCMQEFDKNQDAISFPIWLGVSNNALDLMIKDYNMRNLRGEKKVIGFPSKVYLYSISPKQIRIELVPDGMERVYLDEKDVFPVGTSLPGNMILTKVE